MSTKRLIIRPINLRDFKGCLVTRKASTLSREETNGNKRAISNPDQEDFEAMICYRNAHHEAGTQVILGIFLRASDEFVGEIMLYNIRGISRKVADVGLIIHSAFRGLGYATEAMKALVAFSFKRLGLRRLHGQANPANTVSIRMCQSAGFAVVGTEKVYDSNLKIYTEMISLMATR